MVTFGLVTDIHFGPNTRFEGKLRKLCAQAPDLLAGFVREMADSVRPDFIVNLGDVIEDESRDVDERRYRAALARLQEAPCDVVHVAGNHDTIHLDGATLRRAWGVPAAGPLHYAFDRGPARFIVLRTIEHRDTNITIDDEQLRWLAAELDAAADRPTVLFMHHSAADQNLAANRWFSRTEHIALLEDRAAFRALLRDRGNVVAVFNGHLHWNHLFMADQIPYVTVQSLVENVDDDAPGRAAAAYAVVQLSERKVEVEVRGLEPARYAVELRR
ncbi:MAG: metallophosphoesterase [Deltaproteobacteria bacterium]|jgi:3',5'-cyclic AMP phosphodiesterase CpdA|nr:metallophosphoesterase [Deltaproteobacteria bacterium]MBW2533585.1 metallophosphoesterase [Deltaproteobacteria bacterium]